jgi:integrase
VNPAEGPFPFLGRMRDVTRAVGPSCRAAGVPRYTAHELRHTYAATCLQNGIDLLELQRRLGHADLKTTEACLRVVRSLKGDAKRFAPV